MLHVLPWLPYLRRINRQAGLPYALLLSHPATDLTYNNLKPASFTSRLFVPINTLKSPGSATNFKSLL